MSRILVFLKQYVCYLDILEVTKSAFNKEVRCEQSHTYSLEEWMDLLFHKYALQALIAIKYSMT